MWKECHVWSMKYFADLPQCLLCVYKRIHFYRIRKFSCTWRRYCPFFSFCKSERNPMYAYFYWYWFMTFIPFKDERLKIWTAENKTGSLWRVILWCLQFTVIFFHIEWPEFVEGCCFIELKVWVCIPITVHTGTVVGHVIQWPAVCECITVY